MQTMAKMRAALSVDFEFFQHAPAYRKATGIADTEALGSEGVRVLLEVLGTAGATGTFFTVSDIADSHPDLIQDIVAKGHELASHTHSHRHLSDLSSRERQTELAQSRERLEATAGTAVEGFRAPSFDMPDDHFDLLGKAGYEYDSSVVPCRKIPGWYGGEFRTRHPSPAATIDSDAPPGITEVPVAVMPRLRLPLSGTWLRFFGVNYTILGMRLLARRGIAPVLYVHPWELVDLPDIEGVPRRIYVRSGAYMRRALKRILAEPFDFVSVGALAENVDTDEINTGPPERSDTGTPQ